MERAKRVAALSLLAYICVGAKIGHSQTSFSSTSRDIIDCPRVQPIRLRDELPFQ